MSRYLLITVVCPNGSRDINKELAAVAQWLRASNTFRHICNQHLSGAGSSPAGSVGRNLNLQKIQLSMLNH